MRTLAHLVKVLHAYTHTRKAPHKFDLEQRLNNSATSTASGEHRTFILTFHLSTRSLSERMVPTESSSNLSTPPGAPIYTTGRTNFGIVTTGTKRGSLSANNPHFESDLNTSLNILNYAVRGGGLNAGENSMSDADGGMPKQRVSIDNTGGSESLTTTRSVSQSMSSNLSSRS